MKDTIWSIIKMLSKRNVRKTAIALLAVLCTILFGQDVGLAIQNASGFLSAAVVRA